MLKNDDYQAHSAELMLRYHQTIDAYWVSKVDECYTLLQNYVEILENLVPFYNFCVRIQNMYSHTGIFN